MNADTLHYIREHAGDDVRQLALRSVPANVDLRVALTQIEGRQLAARKLPTWAAADGLLFPPRLSLEQCSSEATAAYKRRVVSTLNSQHSSDIHKVSPYNLSTFLDLTAGFGVDFAAIAPLFSQAVYVEQQAVLCDLARHNLPLLGLPQAEVRCTTAEEVLRELSLEPSSASARVVMIDPARRDMAGRKVALIEDCTPDVCALQEQLRTVAAVTLIKLSPMLDLTAALRSLRGIREAHAVSVDGECKELLLVMAGRPSPDTSCDGGEGPRTEDVPIYCVDLSAASPASVSSGPSSFRFTRAEEAAAPLLLADAVGEFLYEPNASLLKAGAYKIVCQRFPVRKLATNTHLYTSDRLLSDFPSRRWRVVDSASFSKQDLRRLLRDIPAADLTVRGFPTSVATLRKQLRLHEGGAAHFIATTLSDGSRRLIRVENER